MTDTYSANPLHLYHRYHKSSAPVRFVDNRDLIDPLRDSTNGWARACRNVYRPVIKRLFEIMLRRIESQQQYTHGLSMLVHSIVSNQGKG